MLRTYTRDAELWLRGSAPMYVANGDPANDMPAVMLGLGATYHAVGKSGERRISARRFYQGAYSTAAKISRTSHCICL
jgi:aerobic carbon-monoxide dehydrogenase medium subunit